MVTGTKSFEETAHNDPGRMTGHSSPKGLFRRLPPWPATRWSTTRFFFASRFLTILGGVIVFASWTVKSTVQARWDGLKSDLDNAVQVYYPFLSSTYGMNLVQDALGYFPEGEEINWTFLNYKRGLQELARGLPPEEERQWMDSLRVAQDDWALVRISEALMNEIDAQTRLVKARQRRVGMLSTLIYALGSVLIFVGQFREFKGTRPERATTTEPASEQPPEGSRQRAATAT